MYVGCLPVELDPDEQDVRFLLLVSWRAWQFLPCILLSSQNKRLGFSMRHMPLRSISCLRSPGLQAVCKRSLGRYWGRQSWVHHVLIRGCLLQEAALELYTQFNCCVVFLGAELKEKYYKGQPQHIHHLDCRMCAYLTLSFASIEKIPCCAQLSSPRHLSWTDCVAPRLHF